VNLDQQGEGMKLIKKRLVALRVVVATISLALSTGGCALYSETRDKQGQALKEAYSKVDLKGQIEVPRKNRATLLSQQMATVDMNARIQRDGIIRVLATGTADKHTVIGQLDTVSRLAGADAVLGSPATGTDQAPLQSRTQRVAAYNAWIKAGDEVKNLRDRIRQGPQAQFRFVSLPAPTCEDLKPDTKSRVALDKWLAENDAKNGSIAGNAIKAMTPLCKEYADALQTQNSIKVAGMLGQVLARLETEKTKLEDLQAKTAALRAEVDKTLVERADAEEKGKGEEVRAAAEKVQDLLEKIKMADDIFSVQFISDKEQDALNEFLGTITDAPAGKTPPADSPKAAMALVLFPDLFDQAKKQLANADKASLVPLILQKNLSKIAYDSVTREIETRKLRISILEQQATLLRQQVVTFIEVDNLVTSKNFAPLLQKPMVNVLQPTSTSSTAAVDDDQRIWVWKAAAMSTDAGVRHGSEVSKLQFKLNALENEITLGYAEANITQWNTLVSSNVDQMATFAATGIKTEQILALINSLTLLWIGVGVN
jgi:hypothetical protein